LNVAHKSVNVLKSLQLQYVLDLASLRSHATFSKCFLMSR